jgi:hypothetical protein
VTIDERIERLEFQNAAYVEQRRKDWEEYLIRERDMKSHIEAIWQRQERRDEELDKRWGETQDMIRATDVRIEKMNRETDERIEGLVIAIGKFIEKITRRS